MPKFTREQRVKLASEIIERMREVFEAEGIDGVFDEGERWLRDDTDDLELEATYEKWVVCSR